MDTLHPGARRIFERVEEELGQTCLENLCGRPSCLPKMHGAGADKHLSLHFVIQNYSTTYIGDDTGVGYESLYYVES